MLHRNSQDSAPERVLTLGNLEEGDTRMVAATYGIATADKAPVNAINAKVKYAAKGAPAQSWYVRLFDALIDSRMQQARREIAKHVHLLPYTLDARGDRVVKTGKKDMPFGGW
jgi:hypothetical protein